MDLRGSQTQIVKSSNRTQQSKAHANQCNASLSSELTTKMWRRHHLMLASFVPDSTLYMYLDSLLIYRSARVHASGSSISMWQSSWFNQHTISLSVNQSPTVKGLFCSRWCFEYAFWKWEGRQGCRGGKAFFPFTFGGALGKAFFPFTFFYGTGAVGGGTKRSTSE